MYTLVLAPPDLYQQLPLASTPSSFNHTPRGGHPYTYTPQPNLDGLLRPLSQRKQARVSRYSLPETPSLMDSPALSAQAPSTAKSPPNSPETHTNPGRNPALKPVRSNPAMHGPRSRAIMVSRAETPRVILLPARQVSPLARTWFQSHTPLGNCSLSHNHR